jgi:hypothetical protein
MADEYQTLARKLIGPLWPWIADRLNDYQSDAGTYTPTYVGGTTAGTTTYLLQEGEFRRFGNVVHCSGRINWSAATGTGEARILLPSVPAGAYRSTGSLFVDGVTFANTMPQMLVVPGQQYFTMYSALTNAAPTVVAVEAAGLIIWSLTYFIG